MNYFLQTTETRKGSAETKKPGSGGKSGVRRIFSYFL